MRRIPTQTTELIWFPFAPTKVNFALSVMRAAGDRGQRRFGLIHKGDK